MRLRRFQTRPLSIFLAISVLVGPQFHALAQTATPSQDPRAHFADGKLPPALERVANQIGELRDLEALIYRAVQEQTSGDFGEALVIDDGVDLSLEEIRRILSIDVDEGRLIGFGYDALGRDRIASAQLWDAFVYTVGAENVIDGRIVKPVDQPTRLLGEWNRDFMARVHARASSDDRLRGTFFSRINASNMHLVGAVQLTSSFRPQDYQSNLQNRRLLRENSNFNSTTSGRFAGSSTWKLGRSRGIPDVLEFDFEQSSRLLERLDGADVFIEILKEEMQASPFSAQLETSLANAKKYLRVHAFDASTPENTVTSEVWARLSHALTFQVGGPRHFDPIHDLALAVRASQAARAKMPAESSALDEIAQAIDTYARSLERIVAHPSTGTVERERARTALGAIPMMRATLRSVLAEKKIDERLRTDQPNTWLGQFSQSLRKLFVRSKNPFVAPQASTAGHGSHVAGLVAAQDPRIRVVPVRVGLGSIRPSSPERRAELVEQTVNDMMAWLQKPVPARAVQSLLSNEVGVDWREDVQTAEGRRRLAERLKPLIERRLEATAAASHVGIAFNWEIREAVKEAGKRKILVGNMSLGGGHGRLDFEDSQNTAGEKLAAAIPFFIDEYERDRLAETILEHAPHTLWLISAGNSRDWVDGTSISKTPAALRSPWLQEHEFDGPDGRVASSLIDTIVPVSSLNEDGRASEFTNIVLQGPNESIFIRGEDLLSNWRATSLEGALAMIQREVPELFTSYMPLASDPRIQEWLSEGVAPEEANRRMFLFIRQMTLVREAIQASQLIVAIETNEGRRRVSGTSMSSPGAAGKILKLIIEKAKRLGLKPKDLYGRPGFRPQEIFQDFIKSLETYIVARIPRNRLTGTPEQNLTALKASDPRELPRGAGEKRIIERVRALRCSLIFGDR